MWVRMLNFFLIVIFSNQLVNETLFMREEINVGWVFPRNPNRQDDNALSNMYNKCRTILVDIMDCQVHAWSMKFG